MSARWFSENELTEMARPTMDRALDAIAAGDLDEARRLCEQMKGEWQPLYDLMVEVSASLITQIQSMGGDEAVAKAWRDTFERVWRRRHDAVNRRERRDVVPLIAATWRAHSQSGTGPFPGSFSITEDDEKVTFEMHPCGSGQRLVLKGRYDGPNPLGKTQEAHDWSYGRKDFPLYCTHCSFLNELLPILWSGYAMYPSDPPDDFSKDPCTWYWYKRPEDIPERHWRRYGLAKPRNPPARESPGTERP
jgi:hypothetical protein